MTLRRQQSLQMRRNAAEIAAARTHPQHRSNGDEQRLHDGRGKPTYAGNFTKGLPHDHDGFVRDPRDYQHWVRAIDSGDERDIARLRLGPGPFLPNGDYRYADHGRAASHKGASHKGDPHKGDPHKGDPHKGDPHKGDPHKGDPHKGDSPQPQLHWKADYGDNPPDLRGWESQGAGSTFDLEGPDAQAVTMPPCPSLDSQELIAEMGEVYWMALCRDVPFAHWESDQRISAAADSLKHLRWFRRDQTPLGLPGRTDTLPESLARRRVLSENGTDAVPLDKLFRGVTPGEQTGPYISQFLLIGNKGIHPGDAAHALSEGRIAYGAVHIDQRVRQAPKGVDYLTDWPTWLDVQNGAALGGREAAYVGYRFIATPRDLATYVHYDALYEAYLNACLILLGLRAPIDPGLPFDEADYVDRQQGFAQFGGPHILTLVTEVATRALKAVRYQKFNVHRRLRPEAVGGWMYQRRLGDQAVKDKLAALAEMEAEFDGASGIGAQLDQFNNETGNWLLPMAFPEGSPMHPSYGAGHATVAGACVTILKAWFDAGWPLVDDDKPIAYQAKIKHKESGKTVLVDVGSTLPAPLTVEGELNKLAANIAIGRNWAGVHYYSDYYESFLMGEQIAVGLLEEQKLTYGENFSVTVPLFNGASVRI